MHAEIHDHKDDTQLLAPALTPPADRLSRLRAFPGQVVLVPLAAVLIATAIRLAFLSAIGTRATFLTFYPAVILAALLGGLRAGLLATVLSALAADYFWIEPAGFGIANRADWLSLSVFLGNCTIISWLTEAMLRAQTRLRHAQTETRIAAERQRAAEALRESEDRLRFALETSHTGAWDLDLVDHTSFRSLEHDRLFGYTELLPEWTYEMFLEHVLPEDRAAVDATFKQAQAAGTDWTFECRIRRTDGEIRWIWPPDVIALTRPAASAGSPGSSRTSLSGSEPRNSCANCPSG